MYHYVRDLKNSKYPDIKGLDLALFNEQIMYIKKHYNIISAFDFIDAIKSGSTLPPKSLLLTFDDGYSDHYLNVYPILKNHKISGLFFPPAKSITKNQVLDVNKIHFILASIDNKHTLIEDIYENLDKYRSTFNLKKNDYYMKTLGKKNRFDTAEVIFIKRILQHALPKSLREIITNNLFEKYVTKDQTSFSKELYMSISNIIQLQEDGMYVGSHGYEHSWLNHLNSSQQQKEIELSVQFLNTIGSNTNDWIMCYPYGGYNDSLLTLLKKRGCIAGLTTNIGIADIRKDNPLIFPRLDTNHLPKNSNAIPNSWTLKAN